MHGGRDDLMVHDYLNISKDLAIFISKDIGRLRGLTMHVIQGLPVSTVWRKDPTLVHQTLR
jgi:hypothetical protein